MLRFLRLILEAIAAIMGVGVVLAMLLVWRISTKPISSDFMTPTIEAGIESIIPDSTVSIGSTLLTWDATERIISLRVDTIKVDNAEGVEIADIPAVDVKMYAIGLVFGQFLPKEMLIEHPQVKLERTKKGFFVFGTMTVGGQGATNTKSARADDSQNVIIALRKITQQLAHAALMHKMAVSNAVFDVHDDNTGKNWSVSVPEISITRSFFEKSGHILEYGALDGRITVEVTQKDGIASINVHYTYNPADETHGLSTVFNDVTPSFMAGGHPETLGLAAASIIDVPLSGKVELTLDQELSLKTVVAQMQGENGQLVYPDFWDKPFPVKSFKITANYDSDKKTLKVSDAHLDMDGPTIDLAIDGVQSQKAGKDLDFTAAVKVGNLPMNSYGDLWPKAILPDPRYWLLTNLRDGIFAHAEANLNGSLAWNDLANLSVDEGSGKLSAVNGRVIYLDGMPPAENVNADAVFDLDKMDVTISSGGVGDIHMQPFTVTITGLSKHDQDIDIPLQVAGSIPDIMRLIDHKPLEYPKAIGLSVDDITGNIQGAVHFHFPLLKTLDMKDLVLHATANATNVASTKLVPGIAIDKGALVLTLDTNGFGVKGQAELNKIPFDVSLQQNFEIKAGQPLRHIIATGVIRDNQWNDFGIDLLNGSKGDMNVSLDIINPDKKKMVINGAVDMTPSTAKIAMLNWEKATKVPAILKFSATTAPEKDVTVNSISFQGSQLHVGGTAIFSHDMSQLLSLNLAPFVIGRTDATLQLQQTFGTDGSVRFSSKGASFDLAGLRDDDETQPADPRPKAYTLQVDKLYTSKTGELGKATLSSASDQQGWSFINLQGLADGDSPISIELTPQADGQRSFAIRSDDFGKMMKGLGFTDTITGGKLSVVGHSTADNPRVIAGSARISDFTVEKLPVLALLLNATSPFGFAGILTDSADFSRFQGDFRWQGDTVTLTQAHAAGSAIGINIDGKINMNTGDANLQGTLVPFSSFNNILNYIPVIGDILTGGEDQGVLAVSYTIKGSLGAPKISVNPVSLLTPGFLRNLFFTDDTGQESK